MSLSDFLAIIGFAVSIVGIPVTFILAKRGRQVPDLRFITDFDVLVSADEQHLAPGVVVSAAGQQVTSISRSRIAIWNHRGDTVNASEMLPSDPLRIECENSDAILNCRIVKYSKPQIGASVRVDPVSPHVALIDFVFLDAGDGAVIEVVHQKDSSPTVLGTIRGASLRDRGSATLTQEALENVRVRNWFRRFWRRTNWSTRIMVPLLAAISVGALSVAAFGIFRLIGRPTLVQPDLYDLSTVEGQAQFADRVNLVGNPDIAGIAILGIVGLFGIGLSIRQFITIQRNLIPRSIVQN